ncbi:hypothetical protein GGTG_07033 [Gaeumannomyces tritici R3-111a-1]|uniref:RanBP2-type domain-containing protein n=1 Tax=Gaeumannomyces tritici (strain R3-111a-1) TaxID=644352 RepID=J3P0I8_GAET3|nr:hypothetical protein GGTG_07033 [Gaeumannomyces tritici R3-111a-1]EJT77121.1 hypothetical protein GGTG_07033 [Gaeumannomyces tritici R3-111a-1]
MMASSTISHKCGIIKAGLKAVASAALEAAAPPMITSADLCDFRDKFILWSGNMGAMHQPSSSLSLECRLSGAQGVLAHIHRLLGDLRDALEEVLPLLSPQPPDSIRDSATSSEVVGPPGREEELEYAESLAGEISDTLRGLFRAGILVRKATSRDRFAHALKHSTSEFLDLYDKEYVHRKCSKLRRLADQSHWLVHRLGSANVKRRQVQQYYRDHKARLAEPKEGDHEETPTERLSSKATTLAPARLEAEFSKAGTPVEEEYEGAMSVTTAVTTFDRATSLALPRLTDLSQPAEPFECPICFLLSCFSSEKAWKIHAFADIRPYVCTLGGGPECEGLMFPDRNSWFRHELTQHRSQFACAECKVECGSEPKFRDHLAKHGESPGERMDDLVAAGRRVQRTFVAGECPFCDEWEAAKAAASSQVVTGPQLKRHVATHLEQLALFAVPRAVATNNENEEGKKEEEEEAENAREGIPLRYGPGRYITYKPGSWKCCRCEFVNFPFLGTCAICIESERPHDMCGRCTEISLGWEQDKRQHT